MGRCGDLEQAAGLSGGVTSMGNPANMPPPHCIQVFMHTSDAGPNQVGYRKIIHVIHARTAAMPNVLFIDSSCDNHASQLVVKTGLRIVDSWAEDNGLEWHNYHSCLAKLFHVWRDEPKRMYLEMSARCGDAVALKAGTKLPATACASRLDIISGAQKDLVAAGAPRVREVLLNKSEVEDCI